MHEVKSTWSSVFRTSDEGRLIFWLTRGAPYVHFVILGELLRLPDKRVGVWVVCAAQVGVLSRPPEAVLLHSGTQEGANPSAPLKLPLTGEAIKPALDERRTPRRGTSKRKMETCTLVDVRRKHAQEN